MAVKIINRSGWSTPALKMLVDWVVRREGREHFSEYTFVFRSTSDRRNWRGRYNGSARVITIGLHRRLQPAKGWPYTIRDHRFKWSTVETYNSRLEVLVGLIAHEAYHTTGGHRSNFRKNGRVDRARMEFFCNRASQVAVKKFRKDWPMLRSKIKRELRREREKRQRHCEQRAYRKSPEQKLQDVLGKKAEWEAKWKRARNKIAYYGRKVKYYERRLRGKRTIEEG